MLVALFIISSSAQSVDPGDDNFTPNCTIFNSTENEVCKISNLVYVQPSNETLYIEYNGSIEFSNVTLTCSDQCGETIMRWIDPTICCQLIINATGNVTIVGGSGNPASTLRFSNIEIYSNATITVGTLSSLDATGMGYVIGRGYSSLASGASFAAQAGFCDAQKSIPLQYIYGAYYLTPNSTDDLQLQFGSGAGSEDTIGGGRIMLLGRGLQLQGEVKANGLPNVSQPIDNPISYGGSGGYIYLGIKDQVTATRVILSNVKADGGKGLYSGGSGGRIVIDIYSGNYSSSNMTSSTRITVSAMGGGNETSTSCAFGGSGTIYFKNESKLFIQGPSFASSNPFLLAKTVIHGADPRNISGDFQNLSSLVLNRSAIATFTVSNEQDGFSYGSVQSIQLVQQSTILSQSAASELLIIESNKVSLSQSSQIDSRKTVRTLINSTFISTDSSCIIEAGQFLNMIGSVIQLNGTVTAGQKQAPKSLSFSRNNQHVRGKHINYHLKQTQDDSLSQIVIMASNLFALNQPQDPSKQTSMQTDLLFIYSQGDISISGQIQPQILENTCTKTERATVFSFVESPTQLPLTEDKLLENFKSQSNIDQSKDVTMWDLQSNLTNNFTYSMIALGSLNISSTTAIQTQRFASYAAVTKVEGIIDTSGRGCPGGQGIGKGKSSNAICTASGGAHGGRGGRATLINQGDQESICWQYASIPYGTFDAYTVLEGSGGGGISGQPQNDAGAGGGVIWMQAQVMILNQAQLTANGGSSSDPEGANVGAGAGGSIFLGVNQLVGNGSISTIGGDASKQGGGGGSGGRIKFFFFSWFNQNLVQNMTYDLNVTVSASGGPGGQSMQTGQNGTVWSTPCAPGYFGLFCQPCPKGSYKTEFSNIECKQCQSMPEDILKEGSAYYTSMAQTTPMCPYECRDGYPPFDGNHKCLNNIQLFFDNMGGISIFIIIVIATIFAIGALIYFLASSKKNLTLENDENLNKLRLAFEELDFIQRDLHQHICRIYLVGHNEMKSPWVLPVLPPMQIRHRIHLEKYQEFAKRINQSEVRSKSEKFWSKFLPYLYPPLNPLYQKKMRRLHYYSFKKAFIAEAEKIEFWRNYQDTADIELRFTSTDDYTLAYVDFLDTKRTRDSFDRPPLPMTLVIGGTGTFTLPFHINRQDPLVRSINYYCEDKIMWDMFLSNLNSNLLPLGLNNFNFLVEKRLTHVLNLIDKFSKHLFEPKGFKLGLWLLETKSLNKLGGIDQGNETSFIENLDQEEEYYVISQSYLRKKREVLRKLIDYWRTEHFYNKTKVFKLALVITRSDVLQGMSGGSNGTPSPVLPNFGTAGRDGSQNLRGNFNEAMSTIGRQTVVTKNGGGSQEGATPGSYNSPNRRLDTGSPIQRYARKSTEGAQNMINNPMENYVQLIIGSVREIHIDYSRVKIFKNYSHGLMRKEQRDTGYSNASRPHSTWDVTKAYLKELLMFPFSFFNSLALRNSKVIQHFIVAAVLFTICVVVDIIFTATFIVSNISSQIASKIPMVIFFLIYPFATVVSPILGILSLMLCKPFFYRAMSYVNACALFVNLMGYIITELAIDSRTNIVQRLGYQLWVIVGAKLAIAQLLSLSIAYFRNPKYHYYKSKLLELVNKNEELNKVKTLQQRLDMEMVLEQQDENNVSSTTMKRVPFGAYGGGDLTKSPSGAQNHLDAVGRSNRSHSFLSGRSDLD